MEVPKQATALSYIEERSLCTTMMGSGTLEANILQRVLGPAQGVTSTNFN